MLCCYEAVKQAGSQGKVFGLVRNEQEKALLKRVDPRINIIIGDATQSIEVLNKVLEQNDGKELDIAINCVNVGNTEMATILPVKQHGIAYFFSMATAFTKAALGAEGIGKDITMIIGNGYTIGHADITLNDLAESPSLREIFEELYV